MNSTVRKSWSAALRFCLLCTVVMASEQASSAPQAGGGGVPQAAPVSRKLRAEPQKPAQSSTNSTVITSERLAFDYEQRRGVFEKDVHVVSGDVNIDADRIVVLFNPENAATNIVASGSVRIVQADRTAKCDEAVCDIPKGTMVLTGKPEITRGDEIMMGEIITIEREAGSNAVRIRCGPKAYLKLGPKAKIGDIKLSD